MTIYYQACLDYFYSHIPRGTKFRFPGELGIKRSRYLLECLESPQNRLKVIHVAGTSGKGSTAFLTSSLLLSQGLKVGLHLSPHLLDIRERFQINNLLLSEKTVAQYFKTFKKLLSSYRASKYGEPTYFELLVAFAFYVFSEEKVDYAVIETGLGGLYDGTNVVDRADKIAVITTIGKDHIRILGNTLTKIASQKMGIIGKGNLTFTSEKRHKILEQIRKETIRNRTITLYIREGVNFVIKKHQEFDFKFTDFEIKDLKLGLVGNHQIENCSLALAVLVTLSKRDNFQISETNLRRVLEKINFTGRFEVRKKRGNTLILDGAHNLQKMQSLVETLKECYPSEKFIFVMAFKKDKDYRGMLRLIRPLAKRIYLTSFNVSGQDLAHLALDPGLAKTYLASLDFGPVEIISDIQELLITPSKEKLVFTGSLYFLSQVYGIL